MTIDPTTSRSVRTNCDNHQNNVRRRSARCALLLSLQPRPPFPSASSAPSLPRGEKRPASRCGRRCRVPLAPRWPTAAGSPLGAGARGFRSSCSSAS